MKDYINFNFFSTIYIQRKLWLKFLCMVFLCFFLFPHSIYNPLGVGLDDSWAIAIHIAVQNNFIFGKDFIFPFGPLGFLASRLPIFISKYLLLIFDIYLISNLLFIIYFILKKNFSLLSVALTFLILIVIGDFYNAEIVWPLLFIFYFMIYMSLNKNLSAIYLTNASIIVNLMFFIKVNLGILTYFIFIIFLIYGLITKKINYKVVAAIFLFSMSLLFSFSFFLKVDLVNYIKGSWAIIDAYNDAMYFKVFKMSYLSWALITIAIFSLVILLSAKKIIKNKLSILIIFFTCLTVYILFKQSFVRADNYHIYSFFRYITPVFILPWIFIENLKKQFLFLIIISLGISFIPLSKTIELKDIISRFGNIGNYISEANPYPSDLQLDVAIPDTILSKLKNKTADIIPFSISCIYFNKLNYNPRPVIQSYAAYNSYLDNENQKKYLSNTAPDYIFYEIPAIDDRYHLWEETRTKLAICQKYKVDGIWDNMFLLKRTDHTLTIDTVKITSRIIQFKKLNIIPRWEGACIARIKIKYSLLGSLKRLLYQPPDLYITLCLANKSKHTFRAIKTIIEDGIIINKVVFSPEDMVHFFKSGGLLNENIDSFYLHSSQEWGFSDNIEVEYFHVKLPSLDMSEYLSDFSKGYKTLVPKATNKK